MSKAKKPVKKAAKSTAKPAAKPAKAKAKAPVKAASAAAKTKVTATKGVKSLVKAVAQVFKKNDKPAPKTAAPAAKAQAVKTQKNPAPKAAAKADKAPSKASKKSKTKPAQKDEDFDDDLLAGDEDMNTEEIPDLSEFEEDEAAEDVEEDSDEEYAAEAKPSSDDEIILTDAEGRRYCRVRDCDQVGVVEGYCRYHYLFLWKKIQVRRKILVDGKLERYVEELTARYPDKFLEMIHRDLKSEKDFLSAIAELEIDESAVDNEFEDEAQSYIDEVRGLETTSSSMSDDDDY